MVIFLTYIRFYCFAAIGVVHCLLTSLLLSHTHHLHNYCVSPMIAQSDNNASPADFGRAGTPEFTDELTELTPMLDSINLTPHKVSCCLFSLRESSLARTFPCCERRTCSDWLGSQYSLVYWSASSCTDFWS